MKVSQFTNERGVAVRNQFIIEDEGRGANGNFLKKTTFQSYDSVIAVITLWSLDGENSKEVEIDENYWDYSKTTGKYRNQFLGEDKKETEKKIKAGVYKLTDLNKAK